MTISMGLTVFADTDPVEAADTTVFAVENYDPDALTAEQASEILAYVETLSEEDTFAEDNANLIEKAQIVLTREDTPLYATAAALLPPVIAIILALITKEVYSSLFIGVLAGAVLASNFSLTGTVDLMINDGLVSAVSGSAGIFIFLVVLGVLVSLISKAGASAAFGRWAQTHIKSKVGASLATFVLGVLIFIDDYFNCLTVGSVMQPVTDAHKISRAKLAYLIDATAAPICMIAPISSWAAAISSYVSVEGYSGLTLFVRAIPYNLYSLLTLGFIIALTLMKFDYGPMALHEYNAETKGDLFTSGAEHDAVESEKGSEKGRVIDLVIPVVFLIGIVLIGLLYVGGYFEGGISFFDAFNNTDSTVALPWGGIIALFATAIYLICRRVITFKDAMRSIPAGFNAMGPAIIILTLATALKNMTGLLGAADFVGGIMKGSAAGFAMFLPAVIFIVACFLAFSTGTSWGTSAILLPIVVSLFETPTELMFVAMSAALAGAVCGDHCSPISDTTIMSSAGARCDHINHVSTQMPYSITVAAVSFVCYIFTGIVAETVGTLATAAICLPISFVLMIATLVVIKKVTVKKSPKAGKAQ
ncbi:MAG: Na+/H+ antiporter NhaC family protein [Ruminococcaceae bacterium]|nr:Na+/H+ antiporter NhaC family protein [Oscillospiraceae bacterium]